MEYSPVKFKEKMEKYGFNFKKMFGQNFIIDENIISNIITKSEIDKDTLVIEIGPGAGSLTYALSKHAKNVLCYEIDTTLRELLNDNLNECRNVEIIFKDFLKANVLDDIKKYEYKKLYVVANLPYYITTPIVIKFIEDEVPVDKLVIMVQKEVGDRLTGKPSTKDYNALSVAMSFKTNSQLVCKVKPNSFYPAPNVDSALLLVKAKQTDCSTNFEANFLKFTQEIFSQRRKTVVNNLNGKYGLNKAELNDLLIKNDININLRAETMTVGEIINLYNIVVGTSEEKI